MALSLSMTFGTPCAGGHHIPLTATLTGAINRSTTVTLDRPTLLGPPAPEEVHSAVEVLVRLMVAQLAVKTPANIKSKVEAKTLNLTVVG